MTSDQTLSTLKMCLSVLTELNPWTLPVMWSVYSVNQNPPLLFLVAQNML